MFTHRKDLHVKIRKSMFVSYLINADINKYKSNVCFEIIFYCTLINNLILYRYQICYTNHMT